MTEQTLPTDSADRKATPLAQGLLYYFPAALAEVARVSKAGNDKHNPGQPMHHARGKSTDHADCILRHLVDAGTIDPDDGLRHTAKVAWRALALLQEELEAAGAPLARNAKLPEPDLLPPVFLERAAEFLDAKVAEPQLLQPGDKVRISKPADIDTLDWPDVWVDTMDKTIGRSGVVLKLYGDTPGAIVRTSVGDWGYPPEALTLLSRA